MPVLDVSPELSKYLYANAALNGSHAYLLPKIKATLAGLPDRARVMDLGSGNGSLTAAWARRGWEVCGVDSSESGVRHAASTYSSISFARAQIDSELATVYGNGNFDAVVSAEVVEHLYSPRDLAKCAFDLLRPRGLFVVTTPYNGYLKNVALSISGTMDRHWTVLWDGGHIKFWSWKTIRALLEEAGFEDIQFAGAGRLPFLWKSMVVSCRKPQ